VEPSIPRVHAEYGRTGAVLGGRAQSIFHGVDARWKVEHLLDIGAG